MDVLAPLVKTVEVGCSVERAFEVFTEGIDSWWPADEGHSLGADKVETVVFEPRHGGRLLERWKTGEEHVWGSVSVWEPPRRLAFSWLPNPESGGETEIEVTFEASGDATKVTLEHRGWQRAFPDTEKRRRNYDTGWEFTLGCFEKVASAN